PTSHAISSAPLCDLVGIEAPVVLAPIGCAVTPLLAEGVEDGSKPESSEGATREKGLAAWLLRWECLRSFPARPARPRQRARSTPSTCGWSFGRSSARSWQGAKSLTAQLHQERPAIVRPFIVGGVVGGKGSIRVLGQFDCIGRTI